MSVQLGELKAIEAGIPAVDVSSSSYGGDLLSLQQGDVYTDYTDTVVLDRKQLQELSKIIDRFLDR